MMSTCKVAFLCSRNKDNQHLEGYHERREVFFLSKDEEKNMQRFDAFVRAGMKGEFCRFYVSVNERDLNRAKKNLLCEMVQNDSFDLVHVEARAVSHAMKHDCAATKHWLFDYDDEDVTKLHAFVEEVETYTKVKQLEKTPHGYAVVVEHGFDTRALLEKWGATVTLKRDDMLCLKWDTKKED